MQTTKTIIMPTNGISQAPKSFDWYSLLLTLSVAVASGSFVFAWKMNATIAVIQEQRVQDHESQLDIKQDVNQIKLDIRDLRDRAIRMEREQKQTN